MTSRQTPRTDPPRFRGIRTYRDPLGRFSLRHPSDWHRAELADGRDGVFLSPEAHECGTHAALWVAPLDVHVVAEDLEVLSAGVEKGMSGLSDLTVTASHDGVYGNLLKLERCYTFSQDGAVRQRRAWTLYVDTWQFVLLWQGRTPEDYYYWLPMANYVFTSFELPESLWFATDRDLAGPSGAPVAP